MKDKLVRLEGTKSLAEKFKRLCVNGVYNRNLNHPEGRFVRVLFSNTLRVIHNRELTDVSGRLLSYSSFCLPGTTKCFVTSAGDFFPCEKVAGIERLRIGDVRSGFDVERIIGLLEEVTQIRNEFCSACWAFRLCRACFYHFYGPSGFDKERMSYFCNGIRRETRSLLKLYCSILEENEEALDFLTLLC